MLEGGRFDVLLVAAGDLARVAVGVEGLQVGRDEGVVGRDGGVEGGVLGGDWWGEGAGEMAEAVGESVLVLVFREWVFILFILFFWSCAFGAGFATGTG